MNYSRKILPVLMMLVLATLACSLGRSRNATGTEEAPPQATEAPASPAQQPDEAGPPGADALTEEVTETPGVEAQLPAADATPTEEATSVPSDSGVEGDFEEAELNLSTSLSGLENLNSYRVAFRFDWNGTKVGQPVTGYMEMRSAFVREPPAQELHFEGQGFETGADQGLGEVSFVQVGDTAWFYESQADTWMQVPAGSLDFQEGLFFKPEDLLEDFDVSKGRRSVRPQQVNGVQAFKYTIDERDFVPSDLAAGEEVIRAEGEIYTAVDGGYVVKLAMDADIRYTDPNEIFEEGNIKLTFDISDVNQPISIKPPAEPEAQAGGRDDIPMLPDAAVEFASAEFISYRTNTAVEDATQFYIREMPENGWTADESNMTFDDGAFLNYNKANETASVIISADENGINVLISVTAE